MTTCHPRRVLETPDDGIKFSNLDSSWDEIQHHHGTKMAFTDSDENEKKYRASLIGCSESEQNVLDENQKKHRTLSPSDGQYRGVDRYT